MLRPEEQTEQRVLPSHGDEGVPFFSRRQICVTELGLVRTFICRWQPWLLRLRGCEVSAALRRCRGLRRAGAREARALPRRWGQGAAALEAVALARFTTAKTAFIKTDALKCRPAAVAEVGLGFLAGFLGRSVHRGEPWEVCKGGKHLKWHHGLWDCNSDYPLGVWFLTLFSSHWCKLQVRKAFALGKGPTSAYCTSIHCSFICLFFKCNGVCFCLGQTVFI